MDHCKVLVRALFSFILLAGLVAGTILSSNNPTVRAEKLAAAPVCGLLMAQWKFSSGSGLISTDFTNNSWTAGGWPTGAIDGTDFYEFDLDTTGYEEIQMTFAYFSNGGGPQAISIQYSSDGTTFTELQTNNLQPNGSIAVDFSSIVQIENNPHTAFRIYGYHAQQASGTLGVSNLNFTGCQPPTPTLPPTNTPTSTDTPTITLTSTSVPLYSALSLVINEVDWMGTTSCGSHNGSKDQWVELYNPGLSPIGLSGWHLKGSNYYSTVNFDILLSGTISARGYFLIGQNSNVFSANATINIPDSSLNLSNPYQDLELYSPATTLVDSANIQGIYYWPAGSSSNFATMERYYPPGGTIPSDGPTAWVTFAGPTIGSSIPRDYCGNPIHGTPGKANWASTVTETPSPVPTATRKPTPTLAPTPVPAVVLNEILPRPGSDWNRDGLVNNYDEFIEVENLGPGVATLTNWKLKVVPNNGIGSYTLPTLKLNPNQRVAFFGSTTQLRLEDSGETVSLVDTYTVVEDAFTYPPVVQLDDSWCRIRDGIGNWQDGCFPTPGFENALSGILPAPPPPQPGQAAACLLPDVAPAAFRLAECSGFGADIWNQQYWNDLSGQKEYQVPDPNSKGITYIQ